MARVVKRIPLLQMIYDMLNTNVSDGALAARMGVSVKIVKRYRQAVEKFYGVGK